MKTFGMKKYIVRLYENDTIRDYSWNGVDRITIGQKCDDIISMRMPGHIELYSENGRPVGDHDNGKERIHSNIEDMTVFKPYYSDNAAVVIIESHSFFLCVDVSTVDTLTIGRINTDLTLEHKSVSRHHAIITRKNGKLYIEDDGSSNGVYFNNTLINKATVISENDMITIGKYTLVYVDDALLITDIPVKQPEDMISRQFNRAPRLSSSIREETIVIKRPPPLGNKPQMNWLSVILPPISMAIIALLMALIIGTSPTYMLIMIPMQLISVVVAVVNYRKQKTEHADFGKARDEKYKEYLNGIKKKTADAAKKQLAELGKANPEPKECFEILAKMEPSLWERQGTDSDFAQFRIGTGKIKAKVTASWVKDELSFAEDPLEDMAEKLSKATYYIDNAPVLVDGSGNSIIGVAGSEATVFSLISNIVIQAATFHSYEDLRMAFVYSEKASKDWDWVRWLPHTAEEKSGKRLVAYTKTGVSTLMETIGGVLKSRAESDFFAKYENKPHYLLIILSPELLSDRKFLSALSSAGPAVNISAIIATNSINSLPKECEKLIRLQGRSGSVYNKNNSSTETSFICDDNSSIDFEQYARMMAPLKFTESSTGKAIPDSITFMEGYGLKKISEFDIGSAWKNARTDKTMSVPIGIDERGNLFNFDIMDGKHGVHGLIGGMPGSGKSEILQSWILSMALNFSPQDISFILIDFKGTGLITPFVNLPHLAGTISNIDTDIARNIQALRYEISRREQLFDQYAVQSIRNYNRKAYQGEIPEKLPILFVVIDEFAEFKKAFPEFMKWVESSFAKGRSLGIWFILATQNPVADASPSIKENTHFKWCLKVASPSSSKEMLGIADAADIANPGRSFIKVSNSTNDFLVEVQSFWSGAPYSASGAGKTEKIFMVAADGSKFGLSNAETTHATYSAVSEINVIVSYINRFTKENHIPFAKRIWPDKLKTRLSIDELYSDGFNGFSWSDTDHELRPIVGEVDDPMHQRKYPLELAFSDFGHLGVYGAPSSGKTTFIETMVMSMAMMYPPSHVHIYLMDFGGLGLRALEKLPHVGGLAEAGNDELIEKLAYLLKKELEKRKTLFAGEGVGSLKAYNETAEKLPYIVLAADNFNVALRLYPGLEDVFSTLLQSGASYGMYCVLVSNGTNGIGYRFQQSIKMNLALQLADKTDYAMIVGRTDNLVPENVIGRGLVKGTPPLQFQTALPASGATDSEISKNIRNISADMQNAWKGRKTPRIPMMPDKIQYGSVEANGIALGLSHNDICPVVYDYNKQHFLIISAVEREPGTGLLKVVAEQLYEKLSGTRVLIDTIGNSFTGIRKNSDVVLRTAGEIDSYFEALRPELQRRAAEAGQTHEPFTPFIIAVDDFCRFYSIVSNETASRILAIVARGMGMGLYFLTACDSQEIAIQKNRGEHTAVAMVKGKQAVILGGSMNDHPAFQIKADYEQKKVSVKSNEGFVLVENGFTRFKAMEL